MPKYERKQGMFMVGLILLIFVAVGIFFGCMSNRNKAKASEGDRQHAVFLKEEIVKELGASVIIGYLCVDGNVYMQTDEHLAPLMDTCSGSGATCMVSCDRFMGRE
jgi:glucose uptake protein GlcU